MTECSEIRLRLPALWNTLRGYALYLTRDPSKADDLTQDTCVKALRFESLYADGTDLWGWLTTIMYHTFLDDAEREELEELRLRTYGHVVQPSYVVPADTRAAIRDVEDALAALSTRRREMIIRTRLYGYRQKEAARTLGIWPSTANAHVKEGLEALSRHLAA